MDSFSVPAVANKVCICRFVCTHVMFLHVCVCVVCACLSVCSLNIFQIMLGFGFPWTSCPLSGLWLWWGGIHVAVSFLVPSSSTSFLSSGRAVVMCPICVGLLCCENRRRRTRCERDGNTSITQL